MFFKKRIESLEKTIAELEKRLEKVEDKQNEMVITQANQKNDSQMTPARILNEWLNGAKEG
jgi:predicted  nucleic acid-binding Zn-ribbon protein